MARATTATQPAEQFANGIREGGGVWIDLLREGNDRMYRFNRLVLDEAERTQTESAELFSRFLGAPTQLGELTNSMVSTLQNQGRRRALLARKLVNDIGEAVSDTRGLLSRATDAGRETVEATATAGRKAVGRVAHEASKRAEDVSESTEKVARNLKRPARRTARSRRS